MLRLKIKETTCRSSMAANLQPKGSKHLEYLGRRKALHKQCMPKLSDGALLPPLPPTPTPSSAQTMEKSTRNLQINAK